MFIFIFLFSISFAFLHFLPFSILQLLAFSVAHFLRFLSLRSLSPPLLHSKGFATLRRTLQDPPLIQALARRISIVLVAVLVAIVLHLLVVGVQHVPTWEKVASQQQR